jgi:hypothetical protein
MPIVVYYFSKRHVSLMEMNVTLYCYCAVDANLRISY